MQGWKVKGFFFFFKLKQILQWIYPNIKVLHHSSQNEGSDYSLAHTNILNSPKFTQKDGTVATYAETGIYLSGVTVAQPKLVKAREEQRSHGQNLRVELRWPGHGGGPGQKDHPLCSLRTKKKKKKKATLVVEYI